jgi:uncharacterized protein (TIGR03083 family)
VPTSRSLEEHLSTLESSGERLVEEVLIAGLDAPVPTCPAWDGRALLAHQSMVHRFAAANVRAIDPDDFPGQTEILAEVADLPGYYREGLSDLVAALRAAPEDLQARTFLKDAPPPRLFWARRQAHETTVHMADAVSARVGRLPSSGEVAVPVDVAVDGIDELLRGFFTRGRSKLFAGTEYTVLVAPTDASRRWHVSIAEELSVAPGDADRDAAADATLIGTASALYLALWNRGDEIEVAGRDELLAQWRLNQRVRWS